jgi:ketosteroid isomerase-like protein
MSRENVEFVRSICEPWARGDFDPADWAHPDIEYVIAGGPTPDSWTGLAGLAEGWRNFLSAWDDYSAEAEDYLEIEGERVLVLNRFSGRGSSSGVDLSRMPSRGANLFEIREGKVIRLVTYLDRDQALEAVGLREPGGPA